MSSTKQKKNENEKNDKKLKQIYEQNNLAIKYFIHTSCCPTSDNCRMKAIRKIFSFNRKFTFNQFTKLWVGLFYNVWYSEMDKIGEELIYEISYSFPYDPYNYLLAGFHVLATEWFGIDHLRLDKFSFLVRHLLHRVLSYVTYETDETLLINNILKKIDKSIELFSHFTEIYTEEVYRVFMKRVIWDKKDKVNKLYQVFSPFASFVVDNFDDDKYEIMREYIFEELKKTLISREADTVVRNFFIMISDEIINNSKSDKIPNKTRNKIYSLARIFKL